jgi:phosphohistidine swiveling domain-containing protein
MKPLCLDLKELTTAAVPLVGGKAAALGRLARAGLPVPQGLCITTVAYEQYLDATGLRQRLPLLLERKSFAHMRWEELWDLGLRIRNLFINTPLPPDLAEHLAARLSPDLTRLAMTVRSSAPAEDSAAASFAGLHESFVNVRGLPALLDSVRLVWASLWSDRALLYRQELNLDPVGSAMAVLLQELVVGDCSGVAFSRCPGREDLSAIEAVWGLNQGLVDGDIEPDRLLLEPTTGKIIERHTPARTHACRPAGTGVALVALAPKQQETTPLPEATAAQVLALLRQAETLFAGPQDLEWTFSQGTLFALQSRPITTSTTTGDDGERSWYLTLHRSLTSLQGLRRTIEEEILPAMADDAARLAAIDLVSLDHFALAAAIRERRQILEVWQERYRQLCIPMAHGIRLFGQMYNDQLRPGDPFAFLHLLAGDNGLLAVQRNHDLLELAEMLRHDPALTARLRAGGQPEPLAPFTIALARFTHRYGDLALAAQGLTTGTGGLTDLLLEMAAASPVPTRSQQTDEAEFLASFPAEKQEFAREVLAIGRASYRLRDNDNLFIGRLSQRVEEARNEAFRRLADGDIPELAQLVNPAATDPEKRAGRQGPDPPDAGFAGSGNTRLQARQLVGQPAGPGLGLGPARVISQHADLGSFKAGEILVCDAVDPNMTFVVPLAAGIVERRGGMLIHGAIIAREYGLPCVTGVPDATRLIRSGEMLTVDGYLGLVTIAPEKGTDPLPAPPNIDIQANLSKDPGNDPRAAGQDGQT